MIPGVIGERVLLMYGKSAAKSIVIIWIEKKSIRGQDIIAIPELIRGTFQKGIQKKNITIKITPDRMMTH